MGDIAPVPSDGNYEHHNLMKEVHKLGKEIQVAATAFRTKIRRFVEKVQAIISV